MNTSCTWQTGSRLPLSSAKCAFLVPFQGPRPLLLAIPCPLFLCLGPAAHVHGLWRLRAIIGASRDFPNSSRNSFPWFSPDVSFFLLPHSPLHHSRLNSKTLVQHFCRRHCVVSVRALSVNSDHIERNKEDAFSLVWMWTQGWKHPQGRELHARAQVLYTTPPLNRPTRPHLSAERRGLWPPPWPHWPWVSPLHPPIINQPPGGVGDEVEKGRQRESCMWSRCI